MQARSFAHRARKVRVTLSTKRPSRCRPGRQAPIADRAVGPRCRPGRQGWLQCVWASLHGANRLP